MTSPPEWLGFDDPAPMGLTADRAVRPEHGHPAIRARRARAAASPGPGPLAIGPAATADRPHRLIDVDRGWAALQSEVALRVEPVASRPDWANHLNQIEYLGDREPAPVDDD